jgi:hypothetical protein
MGLCALAATFSLAPFFVTNGSGEGKRRAVSMEGMCRHDHSAECFGSVYVTRRARSPEVAIRFSRSGVHRAA